MDVSMMYKYDLLFNKYSPEAFTGTAFGTV